ncbi:MAG: PQQ-binding-like beta-propeller repeat protein [bacterium]|nr:PQQ-binding-like beta-propeller repeat protein [bacterium]
MNRHTALPTLIVALLLILASIGCSGGSAPVSPDTLIAPAPEVQDTVVPGGEQPALTGQSEYKFIPNDKHVYLGTFDVVIDPEKNEVTFTPNRELEIHFNVTQFLLPPNCTTCFGASIVGNDPVTNILSIMVSVRNPTLNVTVYDFRGLILFPELDNRALANAEGYTKVLANGVRSPYQSFGIAKPQRAFGPGETLYAQFDFYFPLPKNLAFAFILECSLPSNQEEVYLISDEGLDGAFNECNSSEGWLFADIHDWQANATGVTVDLTPLGGGVVAMEHVINQTYSTFLNNTEWMAPAGSYKLWFTASSANTTFDTYDFYTLNIAPCDNWPPQWDTTVGITDLNPLAGGFQVVYGTASDPDAPVSYHIYYSKDVPIDWVNAMPITDPDGSPFVLQGAFSDAHTYYVAVRAFDSLGAEEKNTVQLSGIPSNPPDWVSTIGITGVVSMDKAVQVQFGTATDPQTPVTYNVYWSETTPIDFGTANVQNVPGSPYIVPGLSNFHTYHFAVRAMDGFGSEDQNIIELSCIPNGVPEWDSTIGIQSTIPGNGSVTVTYGTATDIDLPVHYNVYYSQTTPINFATASKVQDADGSPYTVTGLTNELVYHFAVRAEDAGNHEELNTVELPGTPNSAPTWLDGEVGVQSLIPFDHQVTVNYGTAVDIDMPITYFIYYSTTTPINFGTASFVTTLDLNSHVVTGLTNYIPYYFCVRAQDSIGIMENNTVEKNTIPNPAPVWSTTIGVQGVQSGFEQLTVTYGIATDLDVPVSYRVYYSQTSPINFGTAPYIDDAGGSPTLIPSLLNGHTYYVAVRARDVYNHEEQNTVTLPGTPMGQPTTVWSVPTGGVVQASPTLVDLNGDTVLDVVIGDQANKMVAYNGVNGSILWTFPTGNWVDSSAAAADMGGIDSTPDIIFGGIDFNVYCVDGKTGAEIWHTPAPAGFISSPTLANIAGDFHPDVVIGAANGVVYAYEGTAGGLIWSFPTGLGIFASPANADLNGDTVPDIVIPSRDGNVYAINGLTGLQLWSFPIGGWINSSPALVNLNGDTVPDVVVGGMNGLVYALNGVNGNQIWAALGIWTFPSTDRIWSSAAMADVTADGIADAIVGSDDGYMYVIDGASGLLIFNYLTGDWIDSSPAAMDMNNDGHVEIAWGGYDGNVTVITADFAPFGTNPWPMFRRDLRHRAKY